MADDVTSKPSTNQTVVSYFTPLFIRRLAAKLFHELCLYKSAVP